MIRLVIVTVLLGSGFLLDGSKSATSPIRNLALSTGISTPIPTTTPERSKCSPCRKPDTDKPNAPPDVTDVVLDKNEVPLPCTESSSQTSPREMTVEVATIAEDADDEILTYVYTVSGGRVVGTGKKVWWNLAEAAAGTYEIVAAVDDGCGICGRTLAKTVTVRECVPSED